MTSGAPSNEAPAWSDGDDLQEFMASVSKPLEIKSEHIAASILTGNINNPNSNLGRIHELLRQVLYHSDRERGARSNAATLPIELKLPNNLSGPKHNEDSVQRNKKIVRDAVDNIYDFCHVDRDSGRGRKIEIITKEGKRERSITYTADGFVFIEIGTWNDPQEEGEADSTRVIVYATFGDTEVFANYVYGLEERRLEERSE